MARPLDPRMCPDPLSPFKQDQSTAEASQHSIAPSATRTMPAPPYARRPNIQTLDSYTTYRTQPTHQSSHISNPFMGHSSWSDQDMSGRISPEILSPSSDSPSHSYGPPPPFLDLSLTKSARFTSYKAPQSRQTGVDSQGDRPVLDPRSGAAVPSHPPHMSMSHAKSLHKPSSEPPSKPSTRLSIQDLLTEPTENPSRAPRTPKAANPVSREPDMHVTASSPAAVKPSYGLFVRQQPVAARACGFGDRDRRVIDPPPILQVSLDISQSTEEQRADLMMTVVHTTIVDESGEQDQSIMADEVRQNRRLMGNTAATPFIGHDDMDVEGCFFCFPDISVRTPGNYRLKFVMLVIEPDSRLGSRTPAAGGILSNVFTVYHAKDFPGMQASSALTKKLKKQGCLISVKKGFDRTNNSRARDDSDDEDEDDFNEAQEYGAFGGGSRAKKMRNP